MLQSVLIIILIFGTMATELPVIGILTLPSDVNGYDSVQYSYIASSYVKWIESSGAQVIPIQWDSTYDQITDLLGKVNGVLFTGGDTDLYLNNTSPGFTFNKFTDTASFILNKVIMSNKAGHYYPLFATCQGFQLINYIISRYYEVLSPVADDMGVQRKLILTGEQSTLLNGLSGNILNFLTQTNGPYYSHHWGVLQSTFDQVPPLQEFFKITGYGTDGAGKQYIAIIEGRDVPVYGVQFHPEKHQFEWNGKASHDAEHITYAQQIGNHFISKARLNNNTIDRVELGNKVIYNYPTTNRMNVQGTSFSEVYLFQRHRVQQKIDAQQLGIRNFKQN